MLHQENKIFLFQVPIFVPKYVCEYIHCFLHASHNTILPLQRHRLVNTTLDEELKTGVHALSIVVSTD